MDDVEVGVNSLEPALFRSLIDDFRVNDVSDCPIRDADDSCVCISTCLSDDEKEEEENRIAEILQEQAKIKEALLETVISVNVAVSFDESIFALGSLQVENLSQSVAAVLGTVFVVVAV